MPDWSSTMKQTFEFYEVDPGTWKNKRILRNVKSCTINRDLSSSTLESASISCEEDLGECYIRVYLVTVQNGVTEKHPLGTFITQTPAVQFDGRAKNITTDAYSPLIELKEKKPPIGYSIPRGKRIMDNAINLTDDNLRAPVIKVADYKCLSSDFVSDTDDTWLSFIIDLMLNSGYRYDLDEMSRVLFAPVQDASSLQPVWKFTDDNSSILYPDINFDRDLYGIPNVVEVIYSDDTRNLYSKIVNKDPNSPISTVNRGREITHREVNPSLSDTPTQKELDDYAKRLLKELSSLECKISYTHGYCPVRIGDGVMLDYKSSGLNLQKAKVITQSIKCESGCPVTETAVYTTSLWG